MWVWIGAGESVDCVHFHVVVECTGVGGEERARRVRRAMLMRRAT